LGDAFLPSIKICRYCFGEGKLRSNILPFFKKKCPNCNGKSKAHVGWNKKQLKLINIDVYKEEK
jgi:DnaJ-class molecular chaperone